MAKVPGTAGGISGLAILGTVAGVVLIVSGLKNASVAETARSLLRGKPVESGPSMLPSKFSGGSSGGGSGTATGTAVAEKAKSYAGVPYSWAHATPDGWDCSGFVTYVLHTDFGLELPSNTHTVTGQFYVWSGALTVPREECQPGDLVCWIGHIGIATSKDTMMHAPGIGMKTQEGSIGFGAVIRRPLAYADQRAAKKGSKG